MIVIRYMMIVIRCDDCYQVWWLLSGIWWLLSGVLIASCQGNYVSSNRELQYHANMTALILPCRQNARLFLTIFSRTIAFTLPNPHRLHAGSLLCVLCEKWKYCRLYDIRVYNIRVYNIRVYSKRVNYMVLGYIITEYIVLGYIWY